MVCRDVLLVGLADETLRSKILWLCSATLLSGERRRKKNNKKADSSVLRPFSVQPAEAGYRCIPSALQLLKEVLTSCTPEEQNQHQESQEDPSAVILGVVANLFQKVIELLARRLRKQPEEGKQVFKLCLLAAL